MANATTVRSMRIEIKRKRSTYWRKGKTTTFEDSSARSLGLSLVEMPPALSDDGLSDLEERAPPRRSTSRSNATSVEDEVEAESPGDGPQENADEDEDEEDLDEDEFIVEAIKKHMIDEDGTLKFQVKWEGYDRKSDLTWEPEENLKESADEILSEYLEKKGGRDSIFSQSDTAVRTKKRGRVASTAGNSTSKRSRKANSHPANSTPPATAKWAPPAGSWEDDIENIDACEEEEGTGRMRIFVLWKNGKKTKHDTSVIYMKCPQKMLQYYERHVRFIRNEARTATAVAENEAVDGT